MKLKRIALWLALVILWSGSLVSCGQNKKYSAHSFAYFDTVTTITGYAESREAFDEVSAMILSSLEAYHRLFTIYDAYEGVHNLYALNELEAGSHPALTVDRRIIDLLLYGKDMYEKTNGKVNIAMGSVLSLWHDYRTAATETPDQAQVPPMDLLTEAAQHTRIQDILIDETASTVTLRDPLMRLDVGAIAKGYAVEMVARSLEEQGITGYVLNIGGNVRTIGHKGDGAPWTVGVENPSGEGEETYIAYLSLAGEALVTSGSYQRFYEVDGVAYHHIIDPKTLMPAEGFLSVSVVTANSADGDALSTALFCMSYEEGLSLVAAFPDTEAMWVLGDGTKVYSPGFEAYQSTP